MAHDSAKVLSELLDKFKNGLISYTQLWDELEAAFGGRDDFEFPLPSPNKAMRSAAHVSI